MSNLQSNTITLSSIWDKIPDTKGTKELSAKDQLLFEARDARKNRCAGAARTKLLLVLDLVEDPTERLWIERLIKDCWESMNMPMFEKTPRELPFGQ